jgi:sugar lactone lactonase YvrE
VLGGLTISNGLGHAPAFDADRGTISEGRVLVTVAEEVGAPDGMTVDAAGDLWVAVYGLNRLYVTTATEDWSDEQRHAEPAAGLVYRFDTDATGRPAAPFRPAPDWWQQVTR